MAAALQPQAVAPGEGWSSSFINNNETLNINHYLVFYPGPKRNPLQCDCVPMSMNRSELLELSAIPIELDPAQWDSIERPLRRAGKALTACEDGFFRFHIAQAEEDNRARLYRKLADSLMYFRRSFRRHARDEDAVVSLAIAFEILLTDGYAAGVDDRVQKGLARQSQQTAKRNYATHLRACTKLGARQFTKVAPSFTSISHERNELTFTPSLG